MATGEGTVGAVRNQLNALDLGQAKRIAAEIHFLEGSLEEKLPLFSQLQSALAPEFQAELRGFLGRLRPVYLRPAQGGGTLPEPRGKDLLFHVRPFPGEPQMRAAYEVALEGFLDHLEAQGYPVVQRGAEWLEVYQPSRANPLDLQSAWRSYVDSAYSFKGLSIKLLPLLNSVRLASRGFSAPKVPVPTLEARDLLAAWYLASLLSIKERLERRAQSIAVLEREVGFAEERERNRKLRELERLCKKQKEEERKYLDALQKKWQEWERELRKLREKRKRLEERLQRAGPEDRRCLQDELSSLASPLAPWALHLLKRGSGNLEWLWEKLDPERTHIVAIRRLGSYLSLFSLVARQQLSTAVGNKFTKILEELLRLLSLRVPEVALPPLLADTPWDLGLRKAGDKADVCYSCGGSLETGKVKATKLIFASPSQRLQSGTGQEEPYVCLSCACLALLSPLKSGDGSVLVRVGPSAQANEEVRQFARLLTMASLNVAAGRYILLNSPLALVYGRAVYALQALGEAINPEVVRHLPFFLLEGTREIGIPRRALWLSSLLQKAFGARPEENGEANRDLGEALRYGLSDLPWHAVYTLARKYGRVWVFPESERGLEIYSCLLREEGMVSLQERFKDVAGLTGLLYAWASRVEDEVGVENEVGRGEAKRAIAKLLDNLESPSTFLYVAAYELDAQKARLYEGGGGFFYQEAHRLLKEAGGVPQEEDDEKGQRYLRVSQDDLHRACAHLAGKYPDKQWKYFVYEVRLSLASRFPRYIRARE